MKLSTRSKYGLQALYELSKDTSAPVAIKTIAKRQDISEAYLEQLFALLRKAEIIVSSRGAQGGYMLARDPKDILVGEILLTLEGSTSVSTCVGGEECGTNCHCPPRSVLVRIQDSIDSVLNTMTLHDMVQEHYINQNML